MKINKLKYMALSGVALLLAAIATTSCDDANDWTTDSSYSRLFKVTKMGITVSATDAEFTWTSTPNTEYYIIEVSKDSLYDAIEMGTTNGSIVYGQDKSITKSPFTLIGLDSSSKYFLRMKSMSATQESKWSYPEEFSFKTKSEQIMQEVGSGDKTATTAILHWAAEAKATHIELLKGDQLDRNINLTDEALEEGTITLEGLEPLTTYTANIYNNEVKRGSITFQTYPSVPAADYTAYLTATDSLNQTLLDEIAGGGYKNVTIALPGDAQYNNSNKLVLPDGMAITFFGLPGEKKATIAIQQFDFSSSHSFIKFQNIEFSGYSVNEEGEKVQNNYIFNQSKATNVGSVEFSDCYIHDFKNTPFRLQGSDIKTIGHLIIDNCIIYGPDSRTYSIIHVDANKGAGKCENITISNSTIWRSGKSFICCTNTNLTKIIVKNCTLSKVPGEGDYIIDLGADGSTSEGIVLESNILGSKGGEKIKGARYKTSSITVLDTYTTTDFSISSNDIKDLSSYSGSEADLFVDPEKGNFTIKDNSFSGKRSCGDPRWYMPE